MDRLNRTLSTTAASALGVLVMGGAITFGAIVMRPMSSNPASDAAAQHQPGGGGADSLAGHGGEEPTYEQPDKPGTDGDSEDFTGVDGADDGDTPYHESEPTPKPEPTDEPTDGTEPTDKPDEPSDKPDEPSDKPDEPSGEPMHLEAFIGDDGKVVVKWYPYDGEFEKYKLVRTTDDNATWPLSGEDELVAVIGPDEWTKFWDSSAPCNVELHYRVFAVRYGEEGYVVLAESNADGVLRECDEPSDPPGEPSALWFEVSNREGGIKLKWEQCSDDSFVVYKVVRSATNESPMYPLNDGDELLAAIGDPGQTWFFDANVESGDTFTYRVLSLGEGPDGWVVLGLTDAITITVE